MSGRRSLVVNAAWSLIAHLLGRGSLVVASILLARSLETVEFAAYSYFQLTVSMLAAYSALGMGVTASRFFAESGHVSEDRAPPVGTLWVLSVLAGLMLALIVLSLPTHWVDGGLEIPRWLISLGVFVTALGVVPAGGILGLERYRDATLAASAAALIVVIGSLVAGRSGSAVGAMWAFVVASLVQAAGNAFVVVREVGTHRLLALTRFGRPELAKIAGFAGPMTAVTLLSASGAWVVGRIILSGTSGEHEFKLYAIGLQWFSLVLLLPGMVSRVVLPRLVRARLAPETDGGANPKAVIWGGVSASLISAVLVFLAGAPLSPWLWTLYGSNALAGTGLIVAFMFAAIPSAPANTIGNAIVANDAQWHWLLITSAWFVSLIGAAKFLSSLGALGGAIAHGLGSALMLLFAAWIARRRGLL